MDNINKFFQVKLNHIMFIVVMQEEAEPIIKEFNLIKQQQQEKINFADLYQSQYKNIIISLIIHQEDQYFKCGVVGSEVAAVLTNTAITYFKPDLIINCGSSGGIIYKDLPPLKVGEVVIGNAAMNVDRTIMIPQYSEYAKGRYPVLEVPELKELGFQFLTIGSTQSFTGDSTFPRAHNIQVVEMEAAAVSRFSYYGKTPCFFVKVISDVDSVKEDQRAKEYVEDLPKVSLILSQKLKLIVDKLIQLKQQQE